MNTSWKICRVLLFWIVAASASTDLRGQQLGDYVETEPEVEPAFSDQDGYDEVDSGFYGDPPLPCCDDVGLFYYDDRSMAYLRTEYIHWYLTSNNVPPLVTTSPVGTSPILGFPDTEVLAGGDLADAKGRSGLRTTLGVRLGYWFPTDAVLEGQVIVLGDDGLGTGDLDITSDGTLQLGRPFFDLGAGLQDAFVVATPGQVFFDPVAGAFDPTLELDSARLQVTSSSDLNGAGIVLRKPWRGDCDFSIDLLAGYRYLDFEESISIVQTQTFVDPVDPTRDASDELLDEFSAASEFHGGELGAVTTLQRGPVRLEILAKLAIGNVHQAVDISGSNETVLPAGSVPDVVSGNTGLLTTTSNIGSFRANTVAVVPELGVTLRRSFDLGFAVTVGYTALAFPEALRVGDQIDTVFDLSGAGTRPAGGLTASTIWVHGINLGVEF